MSRSHENCAFLGSEVLMRPMNEADDIRNLLKSTPLPDMVVEVFPRLGMDSMGAPAVWIWVVVDDAAAASGAIFAAAAEIRDSIRDALEQAGIDRWPYIRFRTRSEMAALATETEP